MTVTQLIAFLNAQTGGNRVVIMSPNTDLAHDVDYVANSTNANGTWTGITQIYPTTQKS